MNIIDYIPKGSKNAVTRQRLADLTGLKDREIRKEIARARREHCICNSQNGAGYYIPESVGEAKRYVEQETHRLKSIGWSMKGAREYIRRHDGCQTES